MGQIKKLAGETMLYGASSIVGRFLNYLLFPLHTLVLSTGSYGVITELYVYAAFLNVIYVYGLETAYFRFATKQEDQEKIIFNTSVTAILISSLFFTLLLVI